jgi:hypothetical protein
MLINWQAVNFVQGFPADIEEKQGIRLRSE